MEVNSFVDTMKKILHKAEEDSGLCLDWHLVSGDPDVVADFGVDYEGNLVIDTISYPIKISELTHIRYRVANDNGDWYFRFDFDDKYVDVCFSDCSFADLFHVFLNGKEYTHLSRTDTILCLKAYKEKNYVINDNKLLKYLGGAETVVVPDGVEIIGTRAFFETDCIKIELPSSDRFIEFIRQLESEPHADFFLSHPTSSNV